MIRHCVFVKFRPEITDAERERIFDGLRALKDKLDILDMGFSANVSPEGFARGFTHGFTMDFRDAAARDAYLVDPDHKAAGSRMVAALEGAREGLLVVDLEV